MCSNHRLIGYAGERMIRRAIRSHLRSQAQLGQEPPSHGMLRGYRSDATLSDGITPDAAIDEIEVMEKGAD